MIAANFPHDGAEQDLGAEIILSYPSDIANGWKAERNAAQTNLDNRLEPIYSRLREGMKQGVRLVEYGENGQKMRISNNDAWYSDFYKEHKRPPNKTELQEIAIDIYKGNGGKYGFSDWEANTAELANAFKEHADEMQGEIDRINLLDSIKDKMLNLSRTELGVMKGLSKEAVKVYQEISSLAHTATSKKAGQSVKTTAILLARHADRIAEIARASGFKDFTAEDYVKGMKFDFSGQGDSLFKGQTVNQNENIVDTSEKAYNIVKEANELYATAIEKFSEIVADKKVKHRVENAIQQTLDFGQAINEIIKRENSQLSLFSEEGLPVDSGRGLTEEGSVQGRETNKLRRTKRIAEQIGLGITRELVNSGVVSLVGRKVNSIQELAEIAQVLRHPGYEKIEYN